MRGIIMENFLINLAIGILLIIGLVFTIIASGDAQTQNENVFSTVPEVNGKVVFQQLVLTTTTTTCGHC